MAHWLNLLIELLLIRSFRVSCPQDDNFFWAQLIRILSDARRRLGPVPPRGIRTVYPVTKQASHSHLTPLLRSSNGAVIGQHKFIDKGKDSESKTLDPDK